MNSLDARFSKNVFEAIQKTCSMCFIGLKTTRLGLVVLNPIKHSCSFFKRYVIFKGVINKQAPTSPQATMLHMLNSKYMFGYLLNS